MQPHRLATESEARMSILASILGLLGLAFLAVLWVGAASSIALLVWGALHGGHGVRAAEG